MNIDQFFNKTYDAVSYNCAHFACDVWKVLIGDDLAHMLRGFLLPRSERKPDLTDLRRVEWLRAPQSPSVVLMKRRGCEPHVGIWYQGAVLHLTPKGVHYQPLEVAAYGFTIVKFFRC